MRLVIGNRNYSSWSFRAWLMMRAVGAEFETVRLALDTPEFADEIERYSPSGRVPVLIDGAVTVWDSLAIGEYLAEHFPAAQLWPAAPAERARARSLSAEMHAGFEALRSELPFNCRAVDRRVRPSEAARRDIDRCISIWENCFLARSAPGIWLMGRFGILDAMYLPVALRFRTYGVEVSGEAARFMKAVEESEVIGEWIDAAREESEIIEKEERGRIRNV